VKVVSRYEPRRVYSDNRFASHRVAEALIGDDTGCILLTLWNEDISSVKKGLSFEIRNAYVKRFKGSLRLNLGRRGSMKLVDSSIEDVNIQNNLSGNKSRFRGRRYNPFSSRRRYSKNKRRG
jgi:replication factor A1